MQPNSSDLLNAVIGKLGADQTLLGLVPNGVYEDISPPGATRFVIVSQILSTDVPVFAQGRVIEDALLLIEARILTTTGGDVRAAAARIDALLEDGALTVPGYQVTALHREEFVRGTEVDVIDPSIVWKRRGGRYRVTAYRQPSASVVALELVGPVFAQQPAVVDVRVWFDGPVRVPPDPSSGSPWRTIFIRALSSDTARWPNVDLNYRPFESDPDVTDPTAPGRAMLYFRQVIDGRGLEGLTFTLSAASFQYGWDLILNAGSSEPVDPSLGSLVLVMPVVPLPLG